MQTRLTAFESAEVLAERARLYAIVDACDAPGVPEKLRALPNNQARSLFKGSSNELLADIAPYLVHVTPEILRWITTELWPEPWGVFAVPRIEKAGDFDALCAHFRRLLMVNAGGQWLYFRFYDPRVLPAFLDSCAEGQAADMFGPFSMFGVTGGAPQAQITWMLMNESHARQSLAP